MYDDYEYTKYDAMRDEYEEKKGDEIARFINETIKWIEKNIEAFGDWGYLAYTDYSDIEWKVIYEEIEENWDDDDFNTIVDTKELFETWVRLLISKGIHPMDEDGNRAEKAPPIPKV